ncbi:MAG TPA: ATP-binding protein [Solirubrobacteraceae bacterium]|nr:ATP-binding protein [Solirubrobacteraceae bacterium]
MTTAAATAQTAGFTPKLVADDELARHWLRQVTLRLRREVLWMAHQRGQTPRARRGALPSPADPAAEALDLVRYWDDKIRFYGHDQTARYLSAQIAAPPPARRARPPRGSFSWVDRELGLHDVERFLLALAMLTSFDGAAGAIVGACLNDPGAAQPTLALAQRLWDEPIELLTVAASGHRLARHGLIEHVERGGVGWRAPLVAPGTVVRQLLFPAPEPPPQLRSLSRGDCIPDAAPDGLEIVPVVGPRGADHGAAAAAACPILDAYDGDPEALTAPGRLEELACSCWLRGAGLYLDLDAAAAVLAARPPRLPTAALPVRLLVAVESRADLAGAPQSRLAPAIAVPRLTYEDRLALWRSALGDRADGAADVARRFRFEAAQIRAVCRRLTRAGDPTRADLLAACRAELELDLGELAEEVRPRFTRSELILPHKQSLQLDEIRAAMGSLADVHHDWGTARVWDEAGLAVLFAGSPGTGKTMAAEVLARELDLPLYRVDLSQVVNKYIGETEKNLRRVFDACEASDLIVLFDEADALFGRRTQVRDAHDRYANLEVSYLLSRMERAKGLTILATNRKDDLDGAFLRRLRYVVDFPLPGPAERREIWRVAIPRRVDASALDLAFLAERFPLTGGHIRSAVFNACLQSAAGGAQRPRLTMEPVLVAVRRELDKAERKVSLERFGAYAELVTGLEEAAG